VLPAEIKPELESSIVSQMANKTGLRQEILEKKRKEKRREEKKRRRKEEERKKERKKKEEERRRREEEEEEEEEVEKLKEERFVKTRHFFFPSPFLAHLSAYPSLEVK